MPQSREAWAAQLLSHVLQLLQSVSLEPVLDQESPQERPATISRPHALQLGEATRSHEDPAQPK